MSARIVVVEDEKEIQNLIVEELEDEGYEIATADNGKEGIEAIKRFKPHLVLSDITMPVMNGHEMLVELREKHANLRSMPIVFLSALADRRHIIEGKKLGVDDYVTKPIDFELLLVTIEARIREVERMTIQKEEQMLKLYQSLMAQPEMASKPKPALIVSNQWVDIDPVQVSLKKLGIPFVTQHRGSQLDHYLDQKKYSAILITDQTNDMPAKLTIANSERFKAADTPKYLLLEDDARAQDMSFWPQFRHVISLGKSTEEIAELISEAV